MSRSNTPNAWLKQAGSHLIDEAALKLLYLAVQNAGMRWRRPVERTAAMGQFAIQFGPRFSGASALTPEIATSPLTEASYTKLRTFPAE
jgi:hypothetical protein